MTGQTTEDLQRAFMEATKPPPSLFELVEAMRAVLQRIDDAEGVVDEAAGGELDALAASIETKAETYAALYRSLNEEADACMRFAENYRNRAARKAAHADMLKARLFEAMQIMKLRRVVTPTATAAIQASAPALELTVPDHDVPAEYIETKRVIRKDLIKAALQRGEKLSFARLTRGEHLRFR